MAEHAIARLTVDEWRGRSLIEWDSITQCARYHSVSIATIKRFIHTGGSLDGYSFFDIPLHSPYDTRMRGTVVEVYDTRTGEAIDPHRRVVRRKQA